MDLLIVEPLGSAVLRWLGSRHVLRYVPGLAADPRALRALLPGARAVVLPPSVTVDARWLEAAPRLRAIGRVSTGAEAIDLEACRRAGVEIVRAPESADTAEAEFVVGALLAMLRRLPVVDEDGLSVGRELGGATVGILGVAPSAEALVRLLGAFGSRVIGYDPALHASSGVFDALGIRPVGLGELFERSDAVAILLPDQPRFQGLVGARLLEVARRDQVLVCVGRSSVVDDAALARALANGPLAAAWFDSLEPGARDPGRPLHGVARLQVSPCIAATTRESQLRSGWAVARRLDALLGGAADDAAGTVTD